VGHEEIVLFGKGEKTLELYSGLRDIVEPPGFVGVVVQQTKIACEAELGWRYATIFSIISPLLRTGIVLSVYSFLHKAELSPCLLNFLVLFCFFSRLQYAYVAV
jgi:hypothetical protein